MWFAVSISLNSSGSGPQRQVKEWQKTWRDWKANVLKKCATNRSYVNGTGGGPAQVIKLTELEEHLLATIGEESAGLPDVPEGGGFDRSIGRSNGPQASKRPCEHVGPQEAVLVKRKRHLLTAGDDVASVHLSHEIDDPELQEQEVENLESLQMQAENAATSRAQEADVLILPSRGLGDHRSNRKNSSVAVELMREELKYKKEKLEIGKEKLRLKKEKLEFTKIAHERYLQILGDISQNIILLRKEDEKIAHHT